MPTVSAAQALQEIQSPASKAISTGLPELDAFSQNGKKALAAGGESSGGSSGGIARGCITEIYGPSGVGKTTFGFIHLPSLLTSLVLMLRRLQLAINALKAGQKVVWIGETFRKDLSKHIDGT